MRTKPESNSGTAEFTPEGYPLGVDQLLVYNLGNLPTEGDTDVSPGATLACDDTLVDDTEPEFPRRVAPLSYPSPASPAAQVKAGHFESIYIRLWRSKLLKKVTDIVLAKAKLPWHLREDATQEIHTEWASVEAKPGYEDGQVAYYAFQSGTHAALKLRRNMGAVVTLPGTLFRTGRASAFMASIGAAVNPKDIDDYKDSLDLSTAPLDYTLGQATLTATTIRARLAGLAITKKQMKMAEQALLHAMTLAAIAEEMGVPLTYVERSLGRITRKLYAKDEDKARAYRPTKNRVRPAYGAAIRDEIKPTRRPEHDVVEPKAAVCA